MHRFRSTKHLVGIALVVAIGAAASAVTSPALAAEPKKTLSLTIASSKLGSIMVDGDGYTIYMFKPDARNVSNCEGQCLTAWPPVMLGKAETLANVATSADLRRSLLGVAMREDGSRQVTYDGRPLYWWFQDTKAGDLKGQSVNNVWWVMNDQGTPVLTRL